MGCNTGHHVLLHTASQLVRHEGGACRSKKRIRPGLVQMHAFPTPVQTFDIGQEPAIAILPHYQAGLVSQLQAATSCFSLNNSAAASSLRSPESGLQCSQLCGLRAVSHRQSVRTCHALHARRMFCTAIQEQGQSSARRCCLHFSTEAQPPDCSTRCDQINDAKVQDGLTPRAGCSCVVTMMHPTP